MEKKIIRTNILNLRKNMQESDVDTKSNEIFRNIISIDFLKYSNYLLYSDFNNEAKTGQIIDFLLKNKKSVYLPMCDINTHTFKASRINSVNFSATINRYGIKEPDRDICNDAAVDCAVIPGIAFNKNGLRLGFGGGYYDRYLDGAKDIFKIGLCYEFQLCDYIEFEKHDIAMDLLITDERVIDCHNSEKYV